MQDLIPSPDEVLTERLSDKAITAERAERYADTKLKLALKEQAAFNRAGLRAIAAVQSAAKAGNVQCQQAQREIAEIMREIFKPQ